MTASTNILMTASPILGPESHLVVRRIPSGHRSLVYADGKLTLSAVPVTKPITFPRTTLMRVCAYIWHSFASLKKIIRRFRRPKFKGSVPVSYFALSVVLLFLLALLSTSLFLSKTQTHDIQKTTLTRTNEEVPPHLDTKRTATPAPAFVNPSADAATPASSSPAPTARPAVSVPYLPAPLSMPPAYAAPVYPAAPMPSAGVFDAIRHGRQPQRQTADSYSEAPEKPAPSQWQTAVDVEIRIPQEKPAAAPSVASNAVTGPDAAGAAESAKAIPDYRVITSNEDALVLRLSDGKFKEIHPGQTLPGGETLLGVNADGAGYKTSVGTFSFPTTGVSK